MREIKFRGYCKEYNEWFYGFGIWDKKNEVRIVYETSPKAEYPLMCESYEVEKDSVGQFTGLKDCNGREIYEGDILKSSRGRGSYTGVIRHNSSYAGFEIKIIKTPAGCEWQIGDSLPLTELNINEAEYEVIGNIYENSELLGDLQ